MTGQQAAEQDSGCICKGNWRKIIAETEPLLDKEFVDDKGEVFVLFGIVHGSDDYYYGLMSRTTGRVVLGSCVGSLETLGYTLKKESDA